MANLINQMNAHSQLRTLLATYGLEALADRAWKYMVQTGSEDPNGMILWLYKQWEFKTRFPAIETLGKKGRAISPAEYIQLEQTYAQILRKAGVLEFMSDKELKKNFTRLISNEVSPQEVMDRVERGFSAVADAAPEVRQAFQQYFGVSGDQALAAFFLSPTKTAPQLLKAAQAAEVGGAAEKMDLDVGIGMATQLATMGVDYEEAMKGMNEVASLSALFEKSINETGYKAADISLHDQTYDTLGVLGQGLAGNPFPEKQPSITNLKAYQQWVRDKAAWDAGGWKKGYTKVGKNDDGINTVDPVNEDGTPWTGPPPKGNVDESGAAYVFGTDAQTQQELKRRLAQRLAAFSGNTTGVSIDRAGRSGVGSAE